MGAYSSSRETKQLLLLKRPDLENTAAEKSKPSDSGCAAFATKFRNLKNALPKNEKQLFVSNQFE